MKGKIKNLLLLLALSVSVCALASACKNNGESSSNSDNSSNSSLEEQIVPSFALKEEGLELDLYEKYNLEYTMSNLVGEIVWVSSAPEIVSVENGALEAKTEGTATITATVGEYSDECVVKVTNNYSIPTLQIVEEISVGKDMTTSVNAKVLWKDKEIDVPLSCEFVSGNASIANVSVADGKVVVEGLEYGSAKYLLTAETHGRILAQSFEVKCLDGDVVFVVENAKPAVGGWISEIALCENENGLPIAYEPQVSVYEQNVKIENAEIAWTLGDGENFREDGGVYYADYLGTQSLVGNYKGNEITITLQSIRPDFVRTGYLALEMVEGTVVPTDLEGVVDGYYINGIDVFGEYDVASNKVTFNQSSLSDPSKMGENLEIIVQTNRARYYYEGSVYTNVIQTEAELKRWVEDAKAATSGTDASGYFVLGDNITCTSEYKAQETYSFGVSANDGFQGLFDGRGYTIENLNVVGDMCGFMPMIGANGVVCNTVFENATLSGRGGFISSHLRGTVYNLYIDISITDNDDVLSSNNSGDRRFYRSVIGSQCESSTIVRDCAVIYRTQVGEDKATGHPFKYLYGSVTGFYMLGHTSFASFEDELQFNNSKRTNFGTYATREDMISDLEAWNEDAHIWDTSFWTMDAEGIPIPIKE